MTRCIIFLCLLLPSAALATSGRTADGCTYKVINGQYLTTCDQAPPSSPSPAPMIAAAAPVVTSYDAVPLRSNPSQPQPSQQYVDATPPSVQSAPARETSLVMDPYELRRQKQRDQFLDSTYVGANLGSTNIRNAGAATGLGVLLGTYLDDHWGFELGYNYSRQDVDLDFSSRGEGLFTNTSSNTSLKAHLVSGEIQGYLTDTFKRLRPYLGLGFAWKASTLEETVEGNRLFGRSSSSSAATLSQSSLGGIGSAGTRLRLAKALHLNLGFRYFFPLARQEAQLDKPRGAEQSLLAKEDDALTGASQYHLLGGLQYAF